MSNVFDTTTTDDLTDEQMQTVISKIGSLLTTRTFRTDKSDPYAKAIIALARLMRDHPELFEEPVDPLRAAFEDWFVKKTGGDPDLLDCELEWEAFKAGMELAKPTEPEWIDWHGGECPVPAGSDCEVRFRDGAVMRDSEPEDWGYCWHNDNDPRDIVAYRVWP